MKVFANNCTIMSMGADLMTHNIPSVDTHYSLIFYICTKLYRSICRRLARALRHIGQR